MDSCTMSDDTFENMVAHCPLLESLTLRNSYFSHLKINAPKLQWLQIEGQFEDITLVNASSLTVAIIDRYDVQVQLPSSSSNLLKLFAHLPQIQQFSIDRHSIKYFSVGAGLLGGKLPNPCLHLRYIFMRLSLYKMDNMLTAPCLLRSSPALEELQMWRDDLSDGGKVNPNLWLDENESCPLAQLRHVRITGLALHGVPAELRVIKFLLANSPVLERITIQPFKRFRRGGHVKDGSLDDSSRLLQKLLQFKRASIDSEIICNKPY